MATPEEQEIVVTAPEGWYLDNFKVEKGLPTQEP